jgi:hypothetical protein
MEVGVENERAGHDPWLSPGRRCGMTAWFIWPVGALALAIGLFSWDARGGATAADLPGKLVLKDSHGGVMGNSGRIWTIEADGRWSLARFTKNGGQPEEVGPPIREGRLTPPQLAELGRVIDEKKLAGLGEWVNEPQRENPHHVTIWLGDKPASMALGRTVKIERAVPEGRGDAGRFLTVVQAILKAVAGT